MLIPINLHYPMTNNKGDDIMFITLLTITMILMLIITIILILKD